VKKFIKNNQSFFCTHCSKFVDIHLSSSRDHCNHCLWGLHVDINPGDRSNKCKGLLKPIGIRKYKNKEQIVYDCLLCSKRVFCIISKDDNLKEIINLVVQMWIEN